MKKTFLFFFFLLFSLSEFCYAGGGMTHMFIAEQIIAKLPDAKLRNLLRDNLDVYLAGAYYPDSGFIKPNKYGEDSHWDPFLNTFADYIKEKYPHADTQNPKIIAFLLGCAVHSVSDIVIHWTFYNESKDRDFKGNWSEAHQYGDPGIDLLLNIDKNQWLTHPLTWWVPVKDLVEVYHRMGKDDYTADQIRWGNFVIYFLGYGERLISPPAYPYLKWRMPWTAANYYNWPKGGVIADEVRVAAYVTQLWNYLENSSPLASYPKMTSKPQVYHEEMNSLVNDFAMKALQSSAVIVPLKTNEDGSIELQQPVVKRIAYFQYLINSLLAKLTWRQT